MSAGRGAARPGAARVALLAVATLAAPRSRCWRSSSALVCVSLALRRSPQWQVGEVDGLLAGGAAAGPALKDGLQQQHRLGQCQAGRR